MALRVLLADESQTIKRVFQLSLQDYGVQVQSVNASSNILSVISSFKPDIIFVDVLLQKRSGYDISKDIKLSDEHKNIPLVLMWSGFMSIDEKRFKDSMAEERLEKPFEMTQLRSLVKGMVSKTKDNQLFKYLKFPQMPGMEEEFWDKEDTSEVSNINPSDASSMIINESAAENTSEELLTTATVVKNPLGSEADINFNKELGEEDASDSSFSSSDYLEDSLELNIASNSPAADHTQAVKDPVENSTHATNQVLPNNKDIEHIIKAETARIIEQAVLKLIPDLAQKAIDKELDRLLSEE